MSIPHNQQIIFGTGPLGLAVMDELVAKGRAVTLVNRSGRITETLPAGVKLVPGDANDVETVAKICNQAEVVYHCAMPPYTDWPEKFPPLTQGILAGVSRTGARLVYGDNLYMYGPTQGHPIHEGLPYAATGRKGRTRAAMAEQLLKAHRAGRLRVAIGRGSDFYGPRALNSTFGQMFFEATLAGKTANLLGNLDLPHTYTYIKDFARALVTLGEGDEALGQAWHVPNAETLTTRQMIGLVEAELGRTIKVRAAGRLMVSILGLFNPLLAEMKEMMYEWEEPYVVNDRRYRQVFGGETTPHRQAIAETVAWYKQRE